MRSCLLLWISPAASLCSTELSFRGLNNWRKLSRRRWQLWSTKTRNLSTSRWVEPAVGPTETTVTRVKNVENRLKNVVAAVNEHGVLEVTFI